MPLLAVTSHSSASLQAFPLHEGLLMSVLEVGVCKQATCTLDRRKARFEAPARANLSSATTSARQTDSHARSYCNAAQVAPACDQRCGEGNRPPQVEFDAEAQLVHEADLPLIRDEISTR